MNWIWAVRILSEAVARGEFSNVTERMSSGKYSRATSFAPYNQMGVMLTLAALALSGLITQDTSKTIVSLEEKFSEPSPRM